ncbi:ABA4-like family protein [Sphingopyxis panaciterrulae]|uniref:DUF4281 domain-containing protein n=1 Tax=Sphingopyxis panaciterrulae TaxID=462372 RepID=A0A7W9B763_9SPHN|nr:ABA4-like family protein [Sphingopyxis panaciterrulae]MBB5707271.1 hypothetical protein [Sphingopyxis panaciterrulae]
MSWETLYSLTNGWALLGWAALAFLPRGPRILSLILYVGVALLCLTYAILLGGLVFGGWDAEGPKAAMDFTSLAGVMALFATKGGMLVGWVHYLAFDLFAGMWIARDADQKGFSRIVQFPFLVLTLLAGPVGLLAWLIVRERRARALARAK